MDMDIKTAQYLSKSFLDGYRRCRGVGLDGFQIPRREEGLEANDAPIPAIVCLAFSAELGLKSILIAEGKAPPRHHDLYQLFYLLSEQSQSKIRESLSSYAEKFDSLLESMRTAFEDWRYIYEPYDPTKKRSVSALSFTDDFLISFSMAAASTVASAQLVSE